MAVGARKRDGSLLEKTCNNLGIGYYTVGDAGMARRALNAVREAFDVACNFDKSEEHKYAIRPKKNSLCDRSNRNNGSGDNETTLIKK